MFAVLIPANFRPERHGWEAADNGATNSWLRWWTPYAWPQCLKYICPCECERKCGGWMAWYGDNTSAQARHYDQVWDEIRGARP